MTNMVVAYHIPHNEGIEYGIFTEPGNSTGLTLVDLYEVDGQIQTFETVEEAEMWLNEEHVRGVPGPGHVEPNKLHHLNQPYQD